MLWSEYDIEFLRENCSSKGHAYCSKALNRSISSIKNKANKLSIKLSSDLVSENMSKSIIDLNDYINVKKPEIAYILGLIWTDGSVSFANNRTKTPIIKHSCVKYDSDVLKRIFIDLNWRQFYSENKKSIGKNTMSTHWLSSRKLGKYLIEKNYRNKVNGTDIYKNFDKDLAPHFVRGLFDGDGCFVASSVENKKYDQFNISFSSTHDQNWEFLTNILDKIDVSYTTRLCEDALGRSSQLNIFRSNSIKNLCEYMYKDSLNLRIERKYDKYRHFCKYKGYAIS